MAACLVGGPLAAQSPKVGDPAERPCRSLYPTCRIWTLRRITDFWGLRRERAADEASGHHAGKSWA